MAFSIYDRISSVIWNTLQTSLYGLKTGVIPEGSEFRLASPWVVDIQNKTYKAQGIMHDLIGLGERRKLNSLSDLLISLSREGGDVGLMTAPFGEPHFKKFDKEMNRKEEVLLQRLEAGGVEIRLHGENHSKFLTTPLMAVTMSSNLTNAALFWHIEQLTLINSDAPGFEQTKTINHDLWRQGVTRNK